MAIKRLQIRAQDLVLGMFVSGLDRPWSQTPFPLQGFHVRTPRDIDTVKSFATYVFIDVTKGRSPSPGTKIYSSQTDGDEVDKKEAVPAYELKPQRADLKKLTSVPPRPVEIRTGVYPKTASLQVEAARAEKIVRELKGNLTLVTKQIAKGRMVKLDELQESVDGMVGSILRCPDAFNWLLRLRHKDQHTYDHSLRTSMLATQFGRYAGFSHGDISVLCMGSLLKDLGKVKIPRAILVKKDRTDQEEEQYRKFVNYGVEILRSLKNVDPKIIAIVRYHCERMDGSGFPQAVGGNKIPLHARVVGIASEYDAISSPRESKYPVAPSRAVSLIYNMRDKEFQEDLVVKFIQSIGLYPTGTMVELTSGDLAVVLEQDPDARLSPTVAVLDRATPYLGESCIFIDLKDEPAARKKLLESGRDNIMNVPKLAIARDLEPTTYDVDLGSISEAFLSSQGVGEESGSSGERQGLLAGFFSRFSRA